MNEEEIQEYDREYSREYRKKHCDRGDPIYERRLMRDREYQKTGSPAYNRHLERVKAYKQKGGPCHEKAVATNRKYRRLPIPRRKNCIRSCHANRWRKIKAVIAPWSELHHEWIPETADYRGVALVEADQHHHGIIDVIRVLEGEITLFNGV